MSLATGGFARNRRTSRSAIAARRDRLDHRGGDALRFLAGDELAQIRLPIPAIDRPGAQRGDAAIRTSPVRGRTTSGAGFGKGTEI